MSNVKTFTITLILLELVLAGCVMLPRPDAKIGIVYREYELVCSHYTSDTLRLKNETIDITSCMAYKCVETIAIMGKMWWDDKIIERNRVNKRKCGI